MDFISNKDIQNNAMLDAIGVKSVHDLFSAIPTSLILQAPSEDDGLSEYETIQLTESLGALNTYPYFKNYLGAGAYEHQVPQLISSITSKAEFLTAYTPYQPEASQGMLQAIFEYQSAVCALTGMDVANASVYDGASACAEGVLMALRLLRSRNKVVIAESVHPHYRAVIEQYVSSHKTVIETLSFDANGSIDLSQVSEVIDDQTACVLLQTPNFFGTVEKLDKVLENAKAAGALSIICANPMSYGLFKSAKDLGADIAVGDLQPFGLPLQFGGPYVGYIACKEALVRQLPGRIVGETVDTQGRRGFVLTLQAREQHIRREKATSNICSNQALAALACLVGILWYGKEGVTKVALANYQRANYLRQGFLKLGIRVMNSGTTFNEFTAVFNRPIDQVIAHFRRHKIEPGVDLSRFFSQLDHHLLIAVTETKSKQDLDHYLAILKELL